MIRFISTTRCLWPSLWRRRIARRQVAERRGFSLLEVVVAMALASVLLGAVWTLFQILTKRQAIELQRAEQNQLLRSLHQRISRDLNNLPAIGAASRPVAKSLVDPDLLTDGRLPWPYSVVDATPALPVQASILRGDQSSLSLTQYVEPVDWQRPGDESEEDSDPRGGREPQPWTQALMKRVVYQLPTWPSDESDKEPTLDEVASDEADEESQFANEPLQLTRTEYAELDFADVATADDADWMSRGSATESPLRDSLDPAIEDSGNESELTASQSQAEAVDGIAAAAWAYFDGQRWRSSWDTDLEGRLPPAIRLRWRFRPIATAAEELIDEDYTAANPPDEFNPMSASENVPSEGVSPDPMTDEDAAPRWYDVEWIFLVQPQAMMGQRSVSDPRVSRIETQPISLAVVTRGFWHCVATWNDFVDSGKRAEFHDDRLRSCLVTAWNFQPPSRSRAVAQRSDRYVGLGGIVAASVALVCDPVAPGPAWSQGQTTQATSSSGLNLKLSIGQRSRGGNHAS